MLRRRRFVPRLDGLEVRELMAAGGAKAAAAAVAPVTAVKTPAWLQRIENLPKLLASVNASRHVPPELITALQQDLLAIAMRLKAPPSWALSQFNRQLRATLPHATAQPQNIAGLNYQFGLVLLKSQAPVDVINKFQKDMLALAAIDSGQSNPAQTVAGDYGTLMQMSMGAGLARPPAAKPTPKPKAR